MGTNPYEAPKSGVADFEPRRDAGGFLHAPRAVAPGRGLAWFTEGWELFVMSPALWIGMLLLFFGILFALGMIPLLGMIAQNVAAPILGAGIVLGCDALRRGQPLTLDHLFEGFVRKRGPLLVLGAIYSGMVLAIVLVAMIPSLAMLGGSLSLLREPDPELMLTAVVLPVLFGLLLMLALLLPVFMAIWFAPALVILNDKEPLDAMRLSFAACLRNIVPFLVYSLVGLLLMLLATLPLLLGWLVLWPWFCTSTFCAYRDIFYAE